MKFRKNFLSAAQVLVGLVAVGSVLMFAGTAFGAISADEAKLLGTTLTKIGAEKAGNADGSIPEYTGGNISPPASYEKGSGLRPNPYSDEKRLLSIDAKNMDKFKDNLTEGTKGLMKKYPSFRIDVYPTHRSVAFPKFVEDNTIKAAQTANLSDENLSLNDAHAAFPFPIPKSGIEVMWNHQVRYYGFHTETLIDTFVTNSAGRNVLVNTGDNWIEIPYWNESDDTGQYFKIRTDIRAPNRRAGEKILAIDPINYSKNDRRAWQYLPGQRRTRLAPDIAYDTPDTTVAGQATYDDLFIYNGRMDRYDYKLVGKKEIYIPYNAYTATYGTKSDELLGSNHLAPDFVRWELHRAWVVEATLKPGKRHLYHKRIFYVDEDSWTALASDQFDRSGALYRTNFALMAPSYELPAPNALTQVLYDLIANTYSLNLFSGNHYGMVTSDEKWDTYEWTPDALSAGGVR